MRIALVIFLWSFLSSMMTFKILFFYSYIMKHTNMMVAITCAVVVTLWSTTHAQSMMMQSDGSSMWSMELTPITTNSSMMTNTPKASTSTMTKADMMMEPDMMEMSMTTMAPMPAMMVDSSTYQPYSPARLNRAFREGKQVILFFEAMDDNGMMLHASLDDHESWIPSNTVVFKVSYPSNKVIVKRYNVTSPNTLLIITKQWNKQYIDARVTSPVTNIDQFLGWLSDYNMMNSEVITMVWGEKMYSSKDIVSNVVNAPNLTTLVAAVKAGWLVATLQSDGPFTVFGPDNAAFAKLPAGTVETLVKPENKDTLVKILTYHVVAGNYTSADLTDGLVLTTVQGQKLTVSNKNWVIKLWSATEGNIATIVTKDVFQKNGVAHVIDTVLLPN